MEGSQKANTPEPSLLEADDKQWGVLSFIMLHKLPETLPYCVWIPSAHSITGQIVPLMWIPVLLLMSVSSLTLVLYTHIFLLRMILGELVIQQALWGRSWCQTPNLNDSQLTTTRPDMVTTLDIECSSSGWQSTTMSWDMGQRKDDVLNLYCW